MSTTFTETAAASGLARRALLISVCIAVGTPGCSGIGRAVVGTKPGARDADPSCDLPTPSCDETPPPTAPLGVPPSAASIDLTKCALLPPLTACDAAPVDASNCQAPLNVDDDADAQEALASQQCANLSVVDDRADPATRLLHLDGADLASANIRIQSALPLTVELAEASLTHVWFELRGPVTLRILSSRLFGDVRVATTDAAAALELEQVNGASLAVGSDPAGFRGVVSIRRSTLRHVQLTADSIELESASLSDVTLLSARLEAADATLLRSAVRAQRSLLASCTVTSTSFTDCSTFSAIQGVYKETTLAACAEALRLYGAEFTDGALDGAIVLDRASVQQVRLGLEEPATIEAWDSELSYLRLCSEGNKATFGGGDSVTCVYPGSGLTCDVDVCTVTEAMFTADTPDCAAFQMPPACALPEPARMRPPLQ
jgi:hypothetical protein